MVSILTLIFTVSAVVILSLNLWILLKVARQITENDEGGGPAKPFHDMPSLNIPPKMFRTFSNTAHRPVIMDDETAAEILEDGKPRF